MNPSFSITVNEAKARVQQLSQDPRPLDRPLVIVSGWMDPGIAHAVLSARFRRLTGDQRIIGVAVGFCPTFEAARRKVIAAVDMAFPCDEPDCTTEVDVIGYSMGGLVSRYAALPEGDGRTLRIARLFTISSPLQGARMAKLAVLGQRELAMKPGSPFITQLNSTQPARPYELTCYVRLGDPIVGEAYAAPPGQTAWWVPNRAFEDAHAGAYRDPRILADIACRLRRDPPLTIGPCPDLPSTQN